MEDAFNKPNRSPNPEGRFTLFPGKGDPKSFTLTPEHQDLIDDLAVQASVVTGKTISRSDVVGAAVEVSKGDVVAWIEQRHAEATGRAEGDPSGAVPTVGT